MQLNRATETYHKQMEERPRLEDEHRQKVAEWEKARASISPQLDPLEKELRLIESKLENTPVPANLDCFGDLELRKLIGFFSPFIGLPLLLVSSEEKPPRNWLIGGTGMIVLGFGVWWMVKSINAMRSVKLRSDLQVSVEAVKQKIAPILPPKPVQLPKLPTKPSNEAAERFMLDEKLGSTFQELEATFTKNRALVERVLEADAGLEKNLSEMDARALLHRTAQEVAAKMGLPLPPSVNMPLRNTQDIKSRYAIIVTKEEGERDLPSELDPDGEIILYGDELHRCWDTLNRIAEHLQLTPLRQFERDGEDDEEDTGPWHDPADGLRTVSGVLQFIRQSTPEQLKPHFKESDVEGVVFDLRAYEIILREAQQEDDPFRIRFVE